LLNAASGKLFDFCEDLARTPGPTRQLANQLLDAGSSIGADLAESEAAYSRRELASKNAISLKESKESKYWLRVAEEKSLGRQDLREWQLQESDEFVAMLTVSVRRLQTEPDPRDAPSLSLES
jgi:four helix bundle protein